MSISTPDLERNRNHSLILIRLAWIVFFSLIGLGILGIVILSLGAANPIKAGSLQYQAGPYELVSNEGKVDSTMPVMLPTVPYTLEITGTLDTADAIWELVLSQKSAADPTQNSTLGSASSPIKNRLSIQLNGYGFFSIYPSQPDSTPFIHIRSVGQPNKLTLEVIPDGKNGTAKGVLRINDEIAWHGSIAPLQTARITLKSTSSSKSQVKLNIQQISLFYQR